ncbi:putative tetraspanin-19-like [Capsicum annuum]|nr:putative tetraspanin-19-like [Capsicum annuum]
MNRGGIGIGGPIRKSFKDSLKVLEADIQHANTLASDFPREYDGACLQMRMSYSPAAHLFLFLVQWTDCHLAGALGLLRILIYKVYVDGTTTMSVQERKASIREFYAVIYPSLLQLERGVTDSEDKKQKAICMERYRRRDDEDYRQSSDSDVEREEECGICMEMNSKIVLPKCNHALCLKCYREWNFLKSIRKFTNNEIACGNLVIMINASDGRQFPAVHNSIVEQNMYWVPVSSFEHADPSYFMRKPPPLERAGGMEEVINKIVK